MVEILGPKGDSCKVYGCLCVLVNCGCVFCSTVVFIRLLELLLCVSRITTILGRTFVYVKIDYWQV